MGSVLVISEKAARVASEQPNPQLLTEEAVRVGGVAKFAATCVANVAAKLVANVVAKVARSRPCPYFRNLQSCVNSPLILCIISLQLPVSHCRRRLDVRQPGLLVQGQHARRQMHPVRAVRMMMMMMM